MKMTMTVRGAFFKRIFFYKFGNICDRWLLFFHEIMPQVVNFGTELKFQSLNQNSLTTRLVHPGRLCRSQFVKVIVINIKPLD